MKQKNQEKHEMNRRRKLMLAVGCICVGFLAIAILEISARFAVPLMNIGPEATAIPLDRQDTKFQLLNWTKKYERHPYFGYAHPRIKAYEKQRTQVPEKPYVIGILGGSVAQSFADYTMQTPGFLSELKRQLPELASKTIVIWNLAAGGYKQPQQYFIASYFLEDIDLFINIDGLNEVVTTDFAPVFPLDYPTLSLRFNSQGSRGLFYRWAGQVVFISYKVLVKAPQQLDLLNKSRAYYLLWYATHEGIYTVVRWLEQRYYQAVVGAVRKQTGYERQPDEQQDIKAKRWRHYTLLQAKLLDREQRRAFLFLQPNQYLKGSKPLSEAERRKAIDPAFEAPFSAAMVRLKTHVAQMQQTRMPIFDLTAIFAHTTQTVYIDRCCHLNDLGNQIMADAILRTMVQNW